MLKTRINDLAIFGGLPAFEEKLHVGRPNICNREQLIERINDILDRRWLTNNGTYVQEFESRLAQFVGVKHCIAMCNGTVALEITIRALGLKDEVIIPSMTFIATAHALQWQQIKPVFCDITSETLTIDTKCVEDMITPRTTGIIGVNIFGKPCNVEELTSIAKKHNLKLIFDSAHAFGCSYNGKMIGSFGNAEIFSFHATKFLNTFEGGAVLTNDDELADKIRLMKNFGFADMDKVIYIGINGKMNEVSAAMGITSLKSMDEIVELNKRNYKHYKKELENIPGITLLTYDERKRNNYQYIVLLIDGKITKITRDQIMEILHEENIIARRYFFPGCHRMEPYFSYFRNAGKFLPVTERIVEQILQLPTGTAITPKEISEICRILRFVIANGEKISKKLRTIYLTKPALQKRARIA